jgi:hypothetical protein
MNFNDQVTVVQLDEILRRVREPKIIEDSTEKWDSDVREQRWGHIGFWDQYCRFSDPKDLYVHSTPELPIETLRHPIGKNGDVQKRWFSACRCEVS